MKRKQLKLAALKSCEAAQFMVVGAWLFSFYLAHTQPTVSWLRSHDSEFLLVLSLFQGAVGLLRPQQEPTTKPDLAPRWSGIIVVLLTGIVAALFLGDAWPDQRQLVIGGVVTATFATALMVWRFATKHASEIGEARFTSSVSK